MHFTNGHVDMFKRDVQESEVKSREWHHRTTNYYGGTSLFLPPRDVTPTELGNVSYEKGGTVLIRERYFKRYYPRLQRYSEYTVVSHKNGSHFPVAEFPPPYYPEYRSFRPRMQNYPQPHRDLLPAGSRPWEESYHRSNPRRRHHLDDIYYANQDDEAYGNRSEDQTARHSYTRAPVRIDIKRQNTVHKLEDSSKEKGASVQKCDDKLNNKYEVKTAAKSNTKNKEPTDVSKPKARDDSRVNDKTVFKADKGDSSNKSSVAPKETVVEGRKSPLKRRSSYHDEPKSKHRKISSEQAKVQETNKIGKCLNDDAKKTSIENSENLVEKPKDSKAEAEEYDIIEELERTINSFSKIDAPQKDDSNKDLVQEGRLTPDTTSSTRPDFKKDIKMKLINSSPSNCSTSTKNATATELKKKCIANTSPKQLKSKNITKNKFPLHVDSQKNNKNTEKAVLEEIFILEDALKDIERGDDNKETTDVKIIEPDPVVVEIKDCEKEEPVVVPKKAIDENVPKIIKIESSNGSETSDSSSPTNIEVARALGHTEQFGDFANLDTRMTYLYSFKRYFDDHRTIDMDISNTPSPSKTFDNTTALPVERLEIDCFEVTVESTVTSNEEKSKLIKNGLYDKNAFRSENEKENSAANINTQLLKMFGEEDTNAKEVNEVAQEKSNFTNLGRRYRSKSFSFGFPVGTTTKVLRKIRSLNDISTDINCFRRENEKGNFKSSNVEDYKDELLSLLLSGCHDGDEVPSKLMTPESAQNASNVDTQKSKCDESKKKKRTRSLDNCDDGPPVSKKSDDRRQKKSFKVDKPPCAKPNSSFTATVKSNIDANIVKPPFKEKYITKAQYVKTFGRIKSPVDVALSIETTPLPSSIKKRRATFTCEIDNETILKKVDKQRTRQTFLELFGPSSDDEEELQMLETNKFEKQKNCHEQKGRCNRDKQNSKPKPEVIRKVSSNKDESKPAKKSNEESKRKDSKTKEKSSKEQGHQRSGTKSKENPIIDKRKSSSKEKIATESRRQSTSSNDSSSNSKQRDKKKKTDKEHSVSKKDKIKVPVRRASSAHQVVAETNKEVASHRIDVDKSDSSETSLVIDESSFLMNRGSENEVDVDVSSESCRPYSIIKPQLKKLSSVETVEDECTNTVYICDAPDIRNDCETVQQPCDAKEDNDVIEITPPVPMVDLTQDDEKDNCPQEALSDLLVETKKEIEDIEGTITLYRAEECPSDQSDVQAVSASVSLRPASTSQMPLLKEELENMPSESEKDVKSDDDSSAVKDKIVARSTTTNQKENTQISNVSMAASVPTVNNRPNFVYRLSNVITNQKSLASKVHALDVATSAERTSSVTSNNEMPPTNGQPEVLAPPLDNDVSSTNQVQLSNGQQVRATPPIDNFVSSTNQVQPANGQQVRATPSVDNFVASTNQRQTTNSRQVHATPSGDNFVASTNQVQPANSLQVQATPPIDHFVPSTNQVQPTNSQQVQATPPINNCGPSLQEAARSGQHRGLPQVLAPLLSKPPQPCTHQSCQVPYLTDTNTLTTTTSPTNGDEVVDLTNDNQELSSIDLKLVVEIFTRHIYFLAHLCNAQKAYVESLIQKSFYNGYFKAEIALFEHEKRCRLYRQSTRLCSELKYLNIRASKHLSDLASLIVDQITVSLKNKDMPKSVTKSIVYLLLGELMKPQEEAFSSVPLFKTLIRHCNIVTSRMQTRSTAGPFTEEMRKTLAVQIQQYIRLCGQSPLLPNQSHVNNTIRLNMGATPLSNHMAPPPYNCSGNQSLPSSSENSLTKLKQFIQLPFSTTDTSYPTSCNVVDIQHDWRQVKQAPMNPPQTNITVRQQKPSPPSMRPEIQPSASASKGQHVFALPRPPTSTRQSSVIVHSNNQLPALAGGPNTNTLGRTPRYLPCYDTPTQNHVYVSSRPPNVNLFRNLSVSYQGRSTTISYTTCATRTTPTSVRSNVHCESTSSQLPPPLCGDSRRQSENLLEELLTPTINKALFAHSKNPVNENFRIKLPFTKPVTPATTTVTTTVAGPFVASSCHEKSEGTTRISTSPAARLLSPPLSSPGAIRVSTSPGMRLQSPPASSPRTSTSPATRLLSPPLSSPGATSSAVRLQSPPMSSPNATRTSTSPATRLLSPPLSSPGTTRVSASSAVRLLSPPMSLSSASATTRLQSPPVSLPRQNVNSDSQQTIEEAEDQQVLVNNTAINNKYVVGEAPTKKVLNQGLQALSSIGKPSAMLNSSTGEAVKKKASSASKKAPPPPPKKSGKLKTTENKPPPKKRGRPPRSSKGKKQTKKNGGVETVEISSDEDAKSQGDIQNPVEPSQDLQKASPTPPVPQEALESAGSKEASAETEVEELETIDLTWIDDMDEQELQSEMDFVFVKQENVENEAAEESNSRVVPSPVDSGIASPPIQNEEDAMYTVVPLVPLCICGQTAYYNCACGEAWYCGQECQVVDWESHQKVCQSLDLTNSNSVT